MHSIRHLLSGGLYQLTGNTSTWVTAGSGVLALVKDGALRRLMGLDEVLLLTQSKAVNCVGEFSSVHPAMEF
jgi:hypothetical protein